MLRYLGKQTVQQHPHPKVRIYEFGFAPLGKSLLRVHVFLVDGVLIDTAQYNAQPAVLRTLQPHRIEQILLTHWHEDHTGNLAAIYEQHRPQSIFAHPGTIKRIQTGFTIAPYEHILLGNATPLRKPMRPLPSAIDSTNYTFVPIHTPGHTDDHTVYFVPKEGWLFAGDLFVAEQIKYFHYREDIVQQISSIQRVLQLDFDVLFCAHNPVLRKGKKALQLKLEHLQTFYEQVALLYRRGMSEKDIMKQLKLKENQLLWLITGGRVGVRHMLRSVIRNEHKMLTAY